MGNSTNLLRLRNLALVAMVFFFNGLFAQLSGIKTIPTNYASIAAFVTDVNAQGVGAGGVTLNVPAGYTETLTGKITLTATGTAADPIIIQKSGAGANPKLTSYVGTVATPSVIADGFFVLAGSDYVTIDGIDLQESAANTTMTTVMEFGYGLFLASASNGSQNNTIKNCVVTLNKLQNTAWTAPGHNGSTGIVVLNGLNTASGAVTPTSASGTNSNNKFYSNTIQNCNAGFVFVSYTDVAPYTLSDVGNDVGGSSLSTGNTILNFGGGGTVNPATGIFINNQYGFNASYNTINNNNGSGVNHTVTLRGIFANVSSNGASMNLNNNTITLKSATLTSQVSAIECSAGSNGSGNTININNNTITGCTNDLATSSTWYGIYNTGNPANLYMDNNTFTNNSTKATTVTTSLLYNSGSVSGNISISGNNLSQLLTHTATQGGTLYYIRNSAGAIAGTLNINNNTFANITHSTLSTTGHYFIYNLASESYTNINNNNWNNLSINSSGTVYMIYNSSSTQVALNVNNNGITTGFSRASAAAGTIYCYYSGSSSLPTSTQTISNNNFSNITASTTGTGTFYGIYNLDGATSPFPQKNIFNNTFNNINYNSTGTFYGIYVSYLGDAGTTQGSRIYNNVISNVTSAFATSYILYPGSSASPNQPAKLYNNTVTNFVSTNTGAGSIYGIYGYAATTAPYIEIYNNKIAGLSSSTSTGKIYGFYGLGSVGGTYRIHNNYFGNLTATGSMNTTMPAPAIAGMFFSSTGAYKVYNNTIYINATSTGANFSTTGIYTTQTGAGNVDFRNNNVVNTSTANGAGLTIGMQWNTASTTPYATTSNNNNWYVGTTSTVNVTYYNGTVSAGTVANMAAITLTDASSIAVAPIFLSTTPTNANYLHINAATPTQIESGGQNMPTFFTTDFDGDIRAGNAGYTGTGATYDIGADEFNGITPAPLITALAGSPALSQLCTTASRTVTCDVTISTGSVATVMLGYSFNGVAQTPVAMTNTTGNTWSGVIPASTPVNATVVWAVTATGTNGINTILSGSYADEPLYGVTSFAWNTGSPICAGTSTGLVANLSANLPATTAPANYDIPVVTAATTDEDLGTVIITQGATTILSNTTTTGNLVGTIGTATGTVGSFSNFTAFGPYAMTAGSSYGFTLTSITQGTFNYNNSMAIFIDYNRNGLFTDPGELVYAASALTSGPHTETGTFTIPLTAYNGLTRMRVYCRETTLTTAYVNTFTYGEYEDYMLNISSTVPGGGTPPAITSVSWASSTVPAYATGNPATINPTVTDNYIATVTSMGCTVNSSSTTVTVNALPAAPIATNSSQCGTSAPTGSVASGAGTSGVGQYYWFDAATNGTLLQSPPTNTYTTFYSNDFTNLTIGSGATLSGSASLSASPGQLQITPNTTNQLGGITVDAGINAQVYKVEFDVTTTPLGGADGFSYSFGDDVNAASTSPTAEKGSGSKLKISFDAYDNVMPNQKGIYILYNNTAATFNATTPGVLAYVQNTSWVGSSNNHVTIDVNAQGGLTLTLNGTVIFNNIALPSAYMYADKSTWKHVIAGRTGGISMQMLFDNLVIQTATQVAGSTTYNTPISATTTFYVSEVGTNGCVSPTTPLVVTVSQPDPIAVTSGVTPALCLGQSFTSTATSNANPAYTYEWDIATYTGSGISAPVVGPVLSAIPTVAGVYPFTVTGTNGICTEVKTVTLTVNALPVITSATATPSPACHDSQVALNASSIVSGPQTLPAGYCSATNMGSAMINQVTFGTISNNTALTNPTGMPYYTNYNLTTNVQPGQTLPLTIINGTSASIISVWIDYNRDGQLAASEWQQVAFNAAAGATVTISVTVPANAQMGLTKMRIRSRLSGNPNGSGDACTTLGSGETEDYLVNIQSSPAIPYSYTWNSTPAINTINGSTTVTNFTSAPVTQTWTITATEAATGCVNTLTTAPVTINQFFTAPTATNSAHCGVQVPTAAVVDGNAFTSPVYNWYTAPTGGTAVQATTSTTLTSAVSATTTYYVSTTNPSTGCESARTPVTVTVSAPPALTLSNATATNCSGLPTPLVTVANGQSSFDSFTWSPSATVAGTSAAGYTFNPTNLVANSPATTTTYTLTATQTSGALCVNTTSIVVSTNALPLITSSTAGPAATCAGTTVNLAAESSTFAPLSVTMGCNSGANTPTTYPTPFGNWYYGAKQQFLFTAAELQAAGLVAGNISSVAFNVTIPFTTALTDYTISMKNSPVTALTTTFETGLTTVYYAASYVPSSLTGYANNTLNFNVASFPWDGTSNVVVEICFNNTTYTNNAVATYCTTFPGAAHYYNADNSTVCAATTAGTVTTNRTDMMFGGTTGTNWTPTLAWSWPALNINGATNTTTAVNAGTTNIQSTYTVQATNTTTGCSNTATTAPITIYALPQIGAGNDILMCTNNGSQNFTPTGTGAGVGGTYTWNNGAINAQPYTVTQTTTFVVTGVDANTCVNYDTMQVVFSTIPPVNAGVDQQICIGQTASFTATGFAPYTWNIASYPGSGISGPVVNPTLVVTPTAPGVYTYTVGVGNSVGCTNDDQIQLTVWALPNVNAGVDQTICNASPAVLSGSGALTYTWTNNVTNATPFFPSSTATYTVDGVDIHGCHNVDQVVVNVLPQPIVNGGIDQTVCATTPVILFAQTTSSTPTAVTGFQWNNSVINGQQFTPNSTATYTVTATGANGCTNQDQVLVTVLALPTVNAGNDITVCAGLSATLNATGAASYSWNNGVTQAIPFYPNATQTYTVTGTGANGCTNQDQVVVNVSTGPNVTVTGNQIVCANAPATLSAASTNSMGGFWTTSNGLGTISPNVSNGTVTYTPTSNDPVVVNLTYVASNACGNASQSTTVTVLPIPTVNAGPDIASCSGLPVTLSATGNGFLTWNNNVSNNVAFIPNSSATYTVTAVGANNCTNTDQMVLTVLALPDVNAGSDQTICSGDNVTLNGSGANSYLWNNGVVNSVAFAPTTTQTYTVTGTALNGCQATDQVLVTVNATPVAIVSVVDDVTVAASPAGMNYQWINCASGTDIPTATTAQFTATANGSYAVIVTSLQGCEDVSDCITIDAVGLDQLNIAEMNVFPNPTNGELNLSLPENVTVNVSIFDAQGKLVAEQMNVANNGKLNISNVTPGVYMVRLTAENAIQTFRVVKN